MQIQLSEELTKHHQQKVKTAVVVIPGKGRVALALSDTHRCARVEGSAKRTLINLAGGEEHVDAVFDDEADLEVAANQLQQHCRRLVGIQDQQ